MSRVDINKILLEHQKDVNDTGERWYVLNYFIVKRTYDQRARQDLPF
jgi:hypothetical protein